MSAPIKIGSKVEVTGNYGKFTGRTEYTVVELVPNKRWPTGFRHEKGGAVYDFASEGGWWRRWPDEAPNEAEVVKEQLFAQGCQQGLRSALTTLQGVEPELGLSIEELLELLRRLKDEQRSTKRDRLPELRQSVTRKFKIPRPEKASRADERASIVRWLQAQKGGAAFADGIASLKHGVPKQQPLKMWVTISTYPDGRPGEMFIKADKSGSLASGALDAVAIALSMAWQHGVPFEATMAKFVGMRFEPNGLTGDQTYPMVASALDYIARWALDRFGKKEES